MNKAFVKLLLSTLGIKQSVKKSYWMHSYRHGSFAIKKNCDPCNRSLPFTDRAFPYCCCLLRTHVFSKMALTHA